MYTPSDSGRTARRTARLRGLPLAGKVTAAGAATVVALGAAVGIAAAGEQAPEPAPYEPAPGEVIEVLGDRSVDPHHPSRFNKMCFLVSVWE